MTFADGQTTLFPNRAADYVATGGLPRNCWMCCARNATFALAHVIATSLRHGLPEASFF